jgi:hypothetical protein
MPEPAPRATTSPAPTAPTSSSKNAKPHPDAVVCERCGVEMFRMHAVWRCPGCGFKTDCCGW